jgi:hypothetical protein
MKILAVTAKFTCLLCSPFDRDEGSNQQLHSLISVEIYFNYSIIT